MAKIEIEDCTAGIIVMDALIGNCLEPFQIRLNEHGIFEYKVRGVPVPYDVYRDSLRLAEMDRFDPRDPRFSSSGSDGNDDGGGQNVMVH